MPMGDLSPQAHRLAAVMALVVIFWIGEPVPVAVTALLGPTLALLVGAVPGKTPAEMTAGAFSRFGDPLLMLFIGGFFIAEAMQVHALDRRIAMRILSLRGFSASPGRLVVGLGVTSCLLSMWMSNTATTALLIPIAGGMLAVARAGGPPGRLDTAAMLMLPFASTVGGLGTPVGTAPNLIGLERMRSAAGIQIGFLQWMAIAVPIAALMMVALSVLLSRGLPSSNVDLRGHALEERRRLGPMSRGEIVTSVSFALAVGLWIASGVAQIWKHSAAAKWFESHLPEGAIALAASSLLFVIPAAPGRPTLRWKEAARIDWGTVILLGGGLSLGEMMRSTGLSGAIGDGVVKWLEVNSLWGLTAVSIALAILLSEITSNTATATMLVPVVIGIAQGAGVPAFPPAIGATLACSFGFMLPVSTPPNALAYGTGMIPIATMARRGVVFDVVGFFVIFLGLRLLCPLCGYA
jgi:sodium-dependent dicarboxylate transporter 2/3/5